MRKHLDQASHNQDFHKCIDESFNDRFFDWKITVLFYIAIHYLKALSVKRSCDIGFTHLEIDHNVNPARDNAKMRINKGAWSDYKSLYQYSKSSRYEGITDIDTFEKIKKIDHSYCLIHLENFKKYMKSQSIDV
jgi:hypothetical protein